MSKQNVLLTPFKIGKEEIKNRFVMGPMGFGQVFDSHGALSDDGVEFYVERARGGYGLLYTGTMMVDNQVDNYPITLTPNPLYAPARFMVGASRLVERCAAYGTKVIAELGFGAGQNAPYGTAPSAVECFGYPDIKSVELTKDQIKKKEDCMIQAAQIMKSSGFAGVDLHALHWGYLLDEFAMSITNHRTDEYGGSLDNRLRVVREIVEGIHQTCGEDFPVTVGLGVKSFIKALNQASLSGEEEAGRTVEEAVEIAKKLEEMGIAAILLDVGIYDSFYYACPPSYVPKGHGLEYYAPVTKAVNIPTIGRSRMGDPEICRKAVEDGIVDAVAHARPCLADPFFPRKVEMGEPEKIRPCIGCNVGCMGHSVEKGLSGGCAVNPRTMREAFTRPRKALNPHKIAIIGGGAAGMEAAITAADCGHQAELFEKSDVLGGEMIAAGADASKVEVHDFRDWMIREVKEKKVPVHMNRSLTAEEAKAQGFDTIILATGASSIMPKSIKGIDKAVSAEDLLAGKKKAGKKVIVVGGGMIGVETAVDMAKKGCQVTILEALPQIMGVKFVPVQHKMMLYDLIAKYQINVVTGKKLTEVKEGGAEIAPADGTGDAEFLEADTVVMSIGMRSNQELLDEFRGKGMALYEIGSAQKAGDIYSAIHQGFEVVYYLD